MSRIIYFNSKLKFKPSGPLGRVLLLMFMGVFTLQSCTDATFSGATGVRQRPKPKVPKIPTGGPKPPVSLDMEFSGDKKIEPLHNNKIWTATTSGTIKRLTIEGNKVVEQKTWNGGASGTGGLRSYVTEGGLLLARYPYLYFVDPEDGVKSKNIGAGARMCVASYMKNGQRYVIAAWGKGQFREYAMDDKPPYAPKWNEPATRQGKINMPNGTATWGYSCFIDQQQKIFYSQWTHMAAIDLNTYQAANINTVAPNATFRSTTPGVSAYSKGGTKTSYAMSGDSYGNIYNGAGYTSAYEKASDTVWFSHGAQIVVIDRKCLTTENTCSNFKSYSPGVAIGPMSALKDGRIVGLTRGTGQIYLMNLRDKNNLTSGLDVVQVANAGGDPYMYTDFTGATLYITESEQEFKPVDMQGYSASKPIKAAVFKWTPTLAYAAGNLSVEWKNIKLEARCYSNAASKPAYAEVIKVHPSDQGTELNVASCADGKYKHVDVKLTQLNNDSTLVGIDTISVGFKQ